MGRSWCRLYIECIPSVWYDSYSIPPVQADGVINTSASASNKIVTTYITVSFPTLFDRQCAESTQHMHTYFIRRILHS